MTSQMQDIQSKLDKYREEKNALAEVCVTHSYIKFYMQFVQSICIIGSFISSLSVAQFVTFVTIPVLWSQINRNLIKNQQVWCKKVKEIEERSSLFYSQSIDIIILLFSCPKGGNFTLCTHICAPVHRQLILHLHIIFEVVVSSVAYLLVFCLDRFSFWIFSFFGLQILHGVFVFLLGKLLN